MENVQKTHSLLPEKPTSKVDLTLPLFVFALLPFFEPMCFQYYTEVDAWFPAVNTLEGCYLVMRIIVTLFALKACAKTVSWQHDHALLMVLLLSVISVLWSQPMGNVIRRAGICVFFVGLIALLRVMSQYSVKKTLQAVLIIFSVSAILSLISILLFPEGMTAEGRIYFFGGKNSLFVHGIPLVAALSLWCVYSRGSLRNTPVMVSIAYAIVALAINSVGSFLCFSVVAVGLAYLRTGKNAFVFDMRTVIVAVSVVLILFVCLQIGSLFEPVFHLVNRSATFSGRVQLWDQALGLIGKYPLLGTGGDASIVYTLGSNTPVNHPHSFYLHFAVNYGLPALLILMADIFSHGIRFAKKKMYLPLKVAALMLGVLLLHSCFDVVSFYIFILLREFYLLAGDGLGGSVRCRMTFPVKIVLPVPRAKNQLSLSFESLKTGSI